MRKGYSKKRRKKKNKGRNKMKQPYHTKHQILSAITKFRNDNAALKERIHLIQTTVPVKARVTKRIQTMRDKEIELKKKVERVKRKCGHLENALNTTEQEVADERSTSGGHNYLKQERHKVQYQLRVLENNLEQVSARYNKSLADNRKLKKSIGTIQEEKQTFEQIYHRMENELREWKMKISNLIEESNAAFESKDEDLKDVDLIKDYKKNVLQDLTRQFKAMDRLASKTETMSENIRKYSQMEGGNDGKDTRRSSLSINDEEDFRVYTPRKSQILNEPEEAGESERPNVALDLLDVFEYFRTELGLEPKEILSRLEETENQSFSLYVHYDEIHNDMSTLQKSIDEMKEEIHNYERGEIKKEQRRMKSVFQEFQKQTSEAMSNSKLFEDKVFATNEVLESLIEPIRHLFDSTLHCDTGYVIEKYGKFLIHQNNIPLILALVEDKIDKISSFYHWKKKLRKKVILKISSDGDGGQEDGKRKIEIAPPSSMVGESEITELDEPLSIEEMSMRLQNMIQ